MLQSNSTINSWIGMILNKTIEEKSITRNFFNFPLKISNHSIYFLISAILGSILLIISAKIKVPLYPVPMTLQPLAVLLIGMLFGRNLAGATVGLYIFQGVCGLPVFAYGGGYMYLFGPTGGFILGFFVSAIILGSLADRDWGKSLFLSLLCMIIGLFIIYFFGILQLSIMKGFDFALLKGFFPFIIGDLYKLLLAGILIPQIWKFAK